jgi:hypothetical protein
MLLNTHCHYAGSLGRMIPTRPLPTTLVLLARLVPRLRRRPRW